MDLFVRIGLDEAVAKNAVANKKFSAALEQMIRESGILTSSCDKQAGLHLYTLASKLPPESTPLSKTNRQDLYAAIVREEIRTPVQLAAAINYFKTKTAFDKAEFDKECGVNVVISPEEIKATIDATLAEHRERLMQDRYRAVGFVLGQVTQKLKWADGATTKAMYDEAILNLLGPKTEADLAPPKGSPKAPKAEAAKPQAKAAQTLEETKGTGQEEGEEDAWTLPPDDMLKARDLEWAQNTPEQLKAMMEATKGRLMTRFPPEPNGYLHLGHAKAMMRNFGLAKQYNGLCIMRFDDTNPEAEEQEYIDNILENLEFLGHKPARVTYSSDYFETLYELAIKLIKKGKAYVCHQTAEEIKASRDIKASPTGKPIPSPWRDRPIEENLRLFQDMRRGKFEENAAVLRMKGDLDHPNPNLWDTVFYRIRYSPHPHAGDKWCIYPTYDYTHCIIDSLEWITYSMCTLEFEIRRESYYWLLHELDLYKPKVWEYSRLNITNNVLSKRRLRALVEEGHVRGWDDPRLLTINGLRRRGYTASAINGFITSVGISRNNNFIPYERLEHHVRADLLPVARRAFVVSDPLKVVIENFDENKIMTVQAPDYPSDECKSTHDCPITRVVYIERSDFQVQPEKDFIRLAPGRVAHLKNAFNIEVTGYELNADGSVKEIRVKADFENTIKPKAKLHWVSEPKPGVAPLAVELRLYDKLFMSSNPMAVEGDWRLDLNPKSLVIANGFADNYLRTADLKPGTPYQFERLGFFVVDPDTDLSKNYIVFNRTCELKSSFK